MVVNVTTLTNKLSNIFRHTNHYETFSLISCGWLGALALLTWETNGTRIHYGKKASWQRQCDSLGNVLLENLGSCYPCGCYFDNFHLPKHFCRISCKGVNIQDYHVDYNNNIHLFASLSGNIFYTTVF